MFILGRKIIKLDKQIATEAEKSRSNSKAWENLPFLPGKMELQHNASTGKKEHFEARVSFHGYEGRK